MCRYVIVIILVLYQSYSFSQEHHIVKTPDTSSAIQYVKQSSNQIESSLLLKDTLHLSQLLHPDLILGHSNGWTESKNSLLQHLTGTKVSYTAFNNIVFSNIHIVNNRVVTLQKTLDASGNLEGQPFDIRLKILEVWISEGRKWLLLARQSVKIPSDQ
ncbi:MAG: nuclear transport factor 2 family protein [Saprospiraceae bacterium]|nr:nuclear transport factor 2 family protein [Saprospiraceae bacterium]